MITFKQFREETIGKKVSLSNGKYPGECVSLVRQYVVKCLGVPDKAFGNAKEWDERFVREGYGTITTTPRYGDLIVYNVNKYGHIAIYVDEFTMYDQNNGYHDGGKSGYDQLRNFPNRVFIRPNAELLSEEVKPEPTPVPVEPTTPDYMAPLGGIAIGDRIQIVLKGNNKYASSYSGHNAVNTRANGWLGRVKDIWYNNDGSPTFYPFEIETKDANGNYATVGFFTLEDIRKV